MENRLHLLIQRMGIHRKDSQLLLHKTIKNPERPLTPSQIGQLIPTNTGRRRDRELVRKKVLRPLVELGLFEKVTAHPRKGILKGHPIPKSPYCAYRLTPSLILHLEKGTPIETLGQKAEEVLECADIFDPLSTHEELVDSCIVHFAEKHLVGFRLIYQDPRHGPKLDLSCIVKLAAAGLEINPGRDPLPDLVFWDDVSDKLCIVEVVVTEGIIDDLRRCTLENWIHEHRPGMEVKYVTAFCSWKSASHFMPHIAANTSVWVQESPFKLWHC